jgi:hypothetical protein
MNCLFGRIYYVKHHIRYQIIRQYFNFKQNGITYVYICPGFTNADRFNIRKNNITPTKPYVSKFNNKLSAMQGIYIENDSKH